MTDVRTDRDWARRSSDRASRYLTPALVVTLLLLVWGAGAAWGRQETSVRLSLIEERLAAHERLQAHSGTPSPDLITLRLNSIDAQLREITERLKAVERKPR